MGAAIPRHATTEPTANAIRPTTVNRPSLLAAHVEDHQPDPADEQGQAEPVHRDDGQPVDAEGQHPEPREAGEPEARLRQLERESREREDEQEIDHRRRGDAVEHPVDRPEVLESDVDGALVDGLLLRRRDVGVQHDRAGRCLHGRAVDAIQQVGDRRGRDLRDVAMSRLRRRERPVDPIDVGLLVPRLDPSGDRVMEPRGPVVRMREIDRIERARLAPRRYPCQR